MDRTAVSSSSIKSIGYDPDSSTLELEFSGGTVHQYEHVPRKVYDDMMAASSVGGFFHAHIRDQYPSVQV